MAGRSQGHALVAAIEHGPATTRYPGRPRCSPKCSTKWSDRVVYKIGSNPVPKTSDNCRLEAGLDGHKGDRGGQTQKESLGGVACPGGECQQGPKRSRRDRPRRQRVGGKVRRMDFPYRAAGRRAPISRGAGSTPWWKRPAALGRAGCHLTGSSRGPVHGWADLFYGRSRGNARRWTGAGELPVAPLRGNRTASRTEHFGRLDLPCLFVSGTRDAFDQRTGGGARTGGDAQCQGGKVRRRDISGSRAGTMGCEVATGQWRPSSGGVAGRPSGGLSSASLCECNHGSRHPG